MLKPAKMSIKEAAYVTGLALASVLVFAVLPKAAQNQDVGGATVSRAVEVGPQNRMFAVIVTQVLVNGQRVECGLTLGPGGPEPATPFPATDDWLKNMTIYLYNRTDKVIDSVFVAVGFPETGDGRTEPRWNYDIQRGRMPAADAFSGATGEPLYVDPGSKPLGFRPNQTLVIHVGDDIDRIASYVGKRMPLPQLTRVIIYGTTVFFNDGMRWESGGGFSVPDPDHRGRYKYLDLGRFFPGRPSHNWPPSA